MSNKKPEFSPNLLTILFRGLCSFTSIGLGSTADLITSRSDSKQYHNGVGGDILAGAVGGDAPSDLNTSSTSSL